jgi:proteasome lid subunit RPN8/RPN11
MDMVQEFLAQAEAAFPLEACGLVVKVGKKTRVLPCRNTHSDPGRAFMIDPNDYAAAEEIGEVLAVYHSHPNNTAEPSMADLASCAALGLPWHIVSWPQAGYRYIEPSGYEAPLEGRQFVYGVHDCMSLVVDYHKTLGIHIPPFDHGEYGWWTKGRSLYMENLDASGFRIVSDLRPNDVILMAFDWGVPHHAAVYLGDDILLQHFDGKLSGKSFYGEFYRKATRHFVRHKSLC